MTTTDTTAAIRASSTPVTGQAPARSAGSSEPAPRRARRPRSAVGRLLVYLALAYGLSWWPWPASDLRTHPDAALMVPIGPSIAAVVLVLWLGGRRDGRALLRSLGDVRIGRWWLALLLPVAIAAAAAAIAVLAGAPAPGPSEMAGAVAAAVVTLPIVLVVGGPLGEELGWRGFVLPRLLERYGPVVASLVLAPMWIGFHLPWIVNKPEQYGPAWALALTGMALTMTWLWLRTRGSLALAVAFHAVINTSTAAAIQLFPEDDRAPAWRIAAALWVTTGLLAAARMSATPHRRGRVRRLRRHVSQLPVLTFVVLSLGVGWGALGGAMALGLPVAPFHLLANYAGLLGSAVGVTALVSGRAGVVALLGGALRWRVTWPVAGVSLLALPLATWAVAWTSGTELSPAGGWTAATASYLLATLLAGVLLFNLAEETAWTGFVQRRLTDRHGTLRGALLTAVPFTAIHLPLAFVGSPPAAEVAVNVAVLAVVGVVFRLLAGMVLAAAGSVLAVATVHASFNASGTLDVVDGAWQSLVALALVTAGTAVAGARAAGGPRWPRRVRA
jgi:membrane protease YdiL (CAAX protease family)